jgi:hypothetical protein
MTEATPAPAPQPSPTPGSRVDAPPGVDFPGKTLGIVGLVLAFITGLVGLILSIIANSQSKAAGYKNMPATIGIIVGIVLTVLALTITIVAIALLVTAAAECASVNCVI